MAIYAISYVEVRIVVKNNETGEVYKSYVEIDNNDNLSPDDFIEYVMNNYKTDVESACAKENETVLEYIEFMEHVWMNECEQENYYFNKVDDLYDIYSYGEFSD